MNPKYQNPFFPFDATLCNFYCNGEVSSSPLGSGDVLVLFSLHFSSRVLEDAADFHEEMEMDSSCPQWEQWNSLYSMFNTSANRSLFYCSEHFLKLSARQSFTI